MTKRELCNGFLGSGSSFSPLKAWDECNGNRFFIYVDYLSRKFLMVNDDSILLTSDQNKMFEAILSVTYSDSKYYAHLFYCTNMFGHWQGKVITELPGVPEPVLYIKYEVDIVAKSATEILRKSIGKIPGIPVATLKKNNYLYLAYYTLSDFTGVPQTENYLNIRLARISMNTVEDVALCAVDGLNGQYSGRVRGTFLIDGQYLCLITKGDSFKTGAMMLIDSASLRVHDYRRKHILNPDPEYPMLITVAPNQIAYCSNERKYLPGGFGSRISKATFNLNYSVATQILSSTYYERVYGLKGLLNGNIVGYRYNAQRQDFLDLCIGTQFIETIYHLGFNTVVFSDRVIYQSGAFGQTKLIEVR